MSCSSNFIKSIAGHTFQILNCEERKTCFIPLHIMAPHYAGLEKTLIFVVENLKKMCMNTFERF